MYNLIKFELYKLRRSKTFKISLILISVCVVFIVFKYFSSSHKLMIFNSVFNGREYGFWINNFKDKLNPKPVEFVHSAMGLIPILEIIVMFLVGEFIIDEYSDGTIKNIIFYGHKREKVCISKIITMAIATLILSSLLFFGTVIGAFISGAIKNFTHVNILQEICFILLIFIIFIAITTCYTFLSILIKNKAIVVTIGMIYIFLSSIFIGRFSLQKYTPTFMLMDIGIIPPTSENIIHMIITCIILIIVTSFLGIFLFKKQDIK